MADSLISISAAAARLAVSPFTIRRLVKSGKLRAVRVARRVLIPESEIARVISQGCEGGVSTVKIGNADVGKRSA